ncbi:MAG TPA: hydroxymethylbilane synthase [Streptosporangiaceae bacterium]|nr:hydroxymethylbilane synthase [Streptosporangiaceae bacterium]
MSGTPLRLGTRRSPMALAQARQVAEMITARTGIGVEITGISTAGDVSQEHLVQIGGTGVFVGALRESLVSGEVDFAVHSLKDLPAGRSAGLTLAAVPRRDDPWDALAGRDGAKLADLPSAARIGTGSPRRAAQIRIMRPDLRPVPIRGNAGTRLAKITSGEVDAVVLAYAGLVRIGRLNVVTQVFGPDEMLPAPGQGALAVECLASRPDLAELLGCIDDPASRAATTAERSVLATLQAGCAAPVGAYAAGTDALRLHAIVAAADGGAALRASADGPADQAERLGGEVAAELLRRGAGMYTDVSAGHLSNGDDEK